MLGISESNRLVKDYMPITISHPGAVINEWAIE